MILSNEQYAKLRNKIREVLPYASFELDNDDQVIIYTDAYLPVED